MIAENIGQFDLCKGACRKGKAGEKETEQAFGKSKHINQNLNRIGDVGSPGGIRGLEYSTGPARLVSIRDHLKVARPNEKEGIHDPLR